MENDVACDHGSFHTNDVADVFQNDETVGQVLPEESRIQVKFDHFFARRNILQVLALDGDHRERNMLVPGIGVEHRL